MSTIRRIDYAPTGASVGHAPPRLERTRTIQDVVDDIGHLRNRSESLVHDSRDIHESIGQLHSDSLDEELRSLTVRHAREHLPTLLDRLSTLGFSWRDIAKIAGVSVPAVRKWRQGESATGDNRQRVARIAALCEIAAERYIIADVAGWLETPLHPDAPLNGLDLMASERFDLVLALAREQPGDPERVLDEFEPDWRARYRSDVEVFTAPDGLPGLRLIGSDS
ncbi:MAG: hypothetical protein OXB99_18010 [Acidimicrobiaceae bacterium]|nr:hypothetical protein [Acidimicrobiaceae bacterium]